MNAVDIISKKRDGKELSTSEIEFFIKAYLNAIYLTIRLGSFDGHIFQTYEREGDF